MKIKYLLYQNVVQNIQKLTNQKRETDRYCQQTKKLIYFRISEKACEKL